MQSNEPTTPTLASLSAVVRLLVDADPKVVAACRLQLSEWGESARNVLDEGARSDEPAVRRVCHELLRRLNLRRAPDRLRELSESDSEGFLERGVALLAEMDHGIRFDRRRMDALLDMLAAELTRMLRGRASPARCLADLMGHRMAFTVDTEAGRRLESHRVDVVLQRRTGAPAALAAVYVLVGRRAGLCVTGVRMLSHHLVRVHGRRPTLLAPASGGKAVLKADCVRYLRDAGWGGPKSRLLADLSDRHLLAALAEQTRIAYGFQEDVEALRILDDFIAVLV